MPTKQTLVLCVDALVEATKLLGRIAGCQLSGCPCNGNQPRHLVFEAFAVLFLIVKQIEAFEAFAVLKKIVKGFFG